MNQSQLHQLVSTKANEPPGNPVTNAVAPSHVAVSSNDELSGSSVVTSNVDEDGQISFVYIQLVNCRR